MALIKKLLIFSILLNCSFYIFSIDIPDASYRSIFGMYSYEIKNNFLIFYKYEGIGKSKKKSEYSIFGKDLSPNNDKYFYSNIFNNDYCIIPGSRFLFLFSMNIDGEVGNDSNFSSIIYDVDSLVDQKRYDSNNAYTYDEGFIDTIFSSSYFNEGSMDYDASLLSKRVVLDAWPIMIWNGDAYPWVEGVTGPGIGETLDICFSKPSRDVVILNGFVDPTRRHLYRYNNRVKTAIIRSDDSGEPFEFEYVFEDVVHFDEIKLPRPADKIIFEIKDVYPGEKWDDTCISAVLTREPDPYK